MKLVSVETPEKSVCKMTFSATAEELEADVCLRRNLAQKLLCGIADLCRTGGVAGGGSDHHRAQNIK